jgi:hypothetical protein
MRSVGGYNWLGLAFWSALAFALGGFCIAQKDPRVDFPEYSSLAHAEGRLAWMQKRKYAVHFGLVGISQKFDYQSSAGALGVVKDALASAGNEPVSVKYEIQTHGPIYSDRKYHDIWEVTISGKPIRTYAQTTERAWRNDGRLFFLLGIAMLGGGFYLGYAAWKIRP